MSSLVVEQAHTVHAGAFTVQGTLGNNRSEKRHNNVLLAVCWESGAGTSAHVNQC